MPAALAERPVERPGSDSRSPIDPRSIRSAQAAWASTPLADRLAVLRRARHLVADRGSEFARVKPGGKPAETMVAEVLPLADAIRFLEREAGAILEPRRLGRRGRPAWLLGVEAEVRREPVGLVLVIGPSNYPLMIPGIQAIQALAAGNAVVWKPGEGGWPVARLFVGVLIDAGLDPDLVALLPESTEAAREAIAAGVDKAFLTGSAEAGRSVLADLAPRLVPATMELSGCDAAFVLPGADLGLVARALAFGLRFHGGETCIAPRRVFVSRAQAAEMERRLIEAFATSPVHPLRPELAERARALIADAIEAGARAIVGHVDIDSPELSGPIVLAGVRPDSWLIREELFAPVLALVAVDGSEAALHVSAACPYALGASIFGPEREAKAFAGRVRAGSVVINDLIAPTADPRVPFGGGGRSGFGLTRGPEGLLEMTAAKVVMVRRGRSRPHYNPMDESDVQLAGAYLAAAHGGSTRARLGGMIRLVGGLAAKARRSGGPGRDKGRRGA